MEILFFFFANKQIDEQDINDWKKMNIYNKMEQNESNLKLSPKRKKMSSFFLVFFGFF